MRKYNEMHPATEALYNEQVLRLVTARCADLGWEVTAERIESLSPGYRIVALLDFDMQAERNKATAARRRAAKKAA